MSILIDRSSRVLIQGITGAVGKAYAERMVEHGTPLVGGISPRKGGSRIAGVPVFDNAADAVRETGGDCVLTAVRNSIALDAICEVVDAGVKLAVLYTENVPVHDAMRMCAYAKAKGVRLLGPNSAGVISPGKANISDMADVRTRQGRIGVVSKSGTLSYEVYDSLHEQGYGESSIVCLGGDPVVGTSYADILPLFERDHETDAVVLVGEPGGLMEFRAADVIKTMIKPVIVYITGRHAPAEKRMGHAGAISGGGDTTAAAKERALIAAGAIAVPVVTDVGVAVKNALVKRNAAIRT